jgi:hypothetical protein
MANAKKTRIGDDAGFLLSMPCHRTDALCQFICHEKTRLLEEGGLDDPSAHATTGGDTGRS